MQCRPSDYFSLVQGLITNNMAETTYIRSLLTLPVSIGYAIAVPPDKFSVTYIRNDIG